MIIIIKYSYEARPNDSRDTLVSLIVQNICACQASNIISTSLHAQALRFALPLKLTTVLKWY